MGIKEFGKNYLEGKAKKHIKNVILKTMPYWGPIVGIILIVIIILAAIQGFMSQEKVDDTISKSENTKLIQSIKEKVDDGNNENTFDENGVKIGKMEDYYETDKNLAMKAGVVEAYLKYEDMAAGSNDVKTKSEKDKIKNTENRVDDILKKLTPKFVYMQSKVNVSKHYVKKVKEFEENKDMPTSIPETLHIYEKRPKKFKADQYVLNDEIYIFNEDKTYSVTTEEGSKKKKFIISSGKPQELEQIILYDKKPSKFEAENYDEGTQIYIFNEDKTYSVKEVDKAEVDKKNSDDYFLTYAKTYQGEFKFTYKTKITKYTNKKHETIEETKPVIKKIKQIGKMYDPLRENLKAENPKEDINEAVAFITGVEEGYDNSSDDMDWTFTDVDVMTYTGGGTFAGKGEKFTGSEKEFIEKVATSAIDTFKKYEVFPSITIAQAILESGWGKSGLTKKANNLFGIKVSDNWKGPYVEMLTKEYKKSKGYYYIMAKFRAYDSWKDSIEDHGKFLRVDNTTYVRHGMFKATDYNGQAYALKRAGYATSPTYAENLINNFIIPKALYQYDSESN